MSGPLPMDNEFLVVCLAGWCCAAAAAIGFVQASHARGHSVVLGALGWLGACSIGPAIIIEGFCLLAYPEEALVRLMAFPLVWFASLGGASVQLASAIAGADPRLASGEGFFFMALGVLAIGLLVLVTATMEDRKPPWASSRTRLLGLLVFVNSLAGLPVLLGLALED